MDNSEKFPAFDTVQPQKSIYDKESENKYDTTFADDPPTPETFIQLAEKLGYQEDEYIAMMRMACIETDYVGTENIPELQGIATFERACDETARRYEGNAERLIVRRGLRLSEASVYFHFHNYPDCINQLRAVYDDVSHESSDVSESSMEVTALIRHVAKVQMGHAASSDTVKIAS